MSYHPTSTPFASGRFHRQLDYPAILAAWNAGATVKEVAARFGCSPAAVAVVRKKARDCGERVRAPRVWRGKAAGPKGLSECITCRRTLTVADRDRKNLLLPKAECCNACGRRWDGVLKFPKRIWVLMKGLLQTADAP